MAEQGGPTRRRPPARSQVQLRAEVALGEARRLYNLGRFDAAMASAEEALAHQALRPQALLVLGRSRLERYRQTADLADLDQARNDLIRIDPALLDPRDRTELVVGLGQALYLDSDFRAAAEVFASALENASALGAYARDQLLDWWATALDRHAQTRPAADRPPIYERIVAQMDHELRRDVTAVSAAYWLAAALRLRGDLDRAWDAVLAGWVRALVAPDRGVALRLDLDELMRDAIIPERARRLTPPGQDAGPAAAALTAEWDRFKARWVRAER